MQRMAERDLPICECLELKLAGAAGKPASPTSTYGLHKARCAAGIQSIEFAGTIKPYSSSTQESSSATFYDPPCLSHARPRQDH